MGTGTAEVYLGGFEVDIALEEGTDLAHRNSRVEHQPHDRGVAVVVAGVPGKEKSRVHLIFFQEDDALVERLVPVRWGRSLSRRPWRYGPNRGTSLRRRPCGITGEALAVARGDRCGTWRTAPTTSSILLNVSLLEEAGELPKVGNVELGRARARARVFRERAAKASIRSVHPHTHHSNGKSVLAWYTARG